MPVKVGIGADGQATPALVKKMAALGINCAVTDLERVDDGKNEQLYYEAFVRVLSWPQDFSMRSNML